MLSPQTPLIRPDNITLQLAIAKHLKQQSRPNFRQNPSVLPIARDLAQIR
jgi:hypothetical protein